MPVAATPIGAAIRVLRWHCGVQQPLKKQKGKKDIKETRLGRAICELLTYTTAVLSGLLCTFHLFRAEKILAPDPEDDSGTSALDVSGVA